MPVFSSFRDPHDRVPLHLVTARGSAPALSIYFDSEGVFGTDFNITVDTTGIILTGDSKEIGIVYTGLSLRAIKDKIRAADVSHNAVTLNNLSTVSAGDLTFDTGDTTADGGFVIRMKRHIVKYNEETRIRLLSPYPEPRDIPWYARVNTGQFSKDFLGSKHIFGVPEYRQQIWSLNYGYPYMDVLGEEPGLVSTKSIRVARTPILWQDNNIRLRVRDRDTFANIIDDVDEHNGIIYLNTEIPDVNGVQIDYVYKELNYIYKDINLNPSIAHNPAIIGQYVLFYVIPEKSQPGDINRTTTIRHIVSHTLLGAINSIPNRGFPVTLLGALQVRQSNTIDDISLLDTRVRGGGIKEERYQESIGLSKHAYSVADFGHADGVPYPGSSVIVFTLPEELKDTMSVEDIKQRATKHMALGVVPIVEFE